MDTSNLGSGRSKDYVINERYNIGTMMDPCFLEAESFVRPIDVKYVPLHVKERHTYFLASRDVFVFTRYGIVVVPKTLVREVS